jgi:predicted HAD superfamily phosphohydrolase
MSFNGCDFAVRKSNVAVMSRDCTVAAVLVQEFYNEGIEAVFDLIENWDRETLKKKDFPDPYLMSAMLESNPKKLPEVHIVNRDNMDEIAKKSDRYRKKILRKER